mmetsp:Transcript_84966/g.275168  ORF Transcript_84966/g.275168 Transcript_84966/m.275168 type:complete len:411 (-) Transcript_84966:60-1292(-)
MSAGPTHHIWGKVEMDLSESKSHLSLSQDSVREERRRQVEEKLKNIVLHSESMTSELSSDDPYDEKVDVNAVRMQIRNRAGLGGAAMGAGRPLSSSSAQGEAAEGDAEEDEEEEDATCSPSDLREIFIVSDSTGESASASVRAALRQFDYCFGSTCGTARSTVYRFVRTPGEARKIAEAAAERNALLVYTVMETKVNEALTSACRAQGVEACDLWGALLETLEKKFGAKRSGVTGRRQAVSEEYMTIVRAIEYTRKVDDGVLPHLWAEADIMLVGPSRAGKTPLAFYLAQRGYKVANYPLVPDEEPPPELFSIPQERCVALMIQPERLQAIRAERMLRLMGKSSTRYASLDALKKEVRWIKNFYLRQGSRWPIIDTTDAGVVETAARIIEIFDRRKGDSLAASYVSPLTE